ARRARAGAGCQGWGAKRGSGCLNGGTWGRAQRVPPGALLVDPPMFQLCLGIPYGAPADTNAMKAMRDELPEGAVWAAFGISRHQMPMVAQSVLPGGHVRVGLEHTRHLKNGAVATNGRLVATQLQDPQPVGRPPPTPTDAP